MIYKVEELLTKEYACTPEELHGTGTIFSIRADAKEPYIKILAYRNCVVVCTSKDLHEKIRGLLAGKSRDEIFELPYVYGQTVHYIPDPGFAKDTTAPPDYSCRFFWEQEVLSLRGLIGFGNSLEFEADGSTPTRAVCIARDREIDGQKDPTFLLCVRNESRLADGSLPVRLYSGLGGYIWNDAGRKHRI